MGRLKAILARLCGLAMVVAAPAGWAAEPVVVFAAASMTDAVSALTHQYNESHDAVVVASYAASSTLARQIEAGAPAQIYISANARWVDYLGGRGVIERRCDLVGNRLMLIAPAGRPLDLDIAVGFDLAAALGDRRLAMGDPNHVPVGLYARQALKTLDVWPSVRDRLVHSADVRATLALVARGEVAAGIVYATDARLSDQVRVVGVFPAASHDAIVYPAARIIGPGNAAADHFFAYLVSNQGRAVFAAFGFDTDITAPCSP
ncbi:MAG: molybdate ABC transporter substrate-binding protein [Pseudomonadota bacterium]|nr:molybdate ABC transporter substrate-binding protein [Pseudomonadota bacterium]